MEVTDEHFLLDLLNSTPVIAGVEHDQLEQTEAWKSAARERSALAAVRSALQDVVRGDQPADVLAPFLRGVRRVPTITADGTVEWILQAPEPQATAVRAVLAWDAVSTTRPGRLRPCENSECRLFLIDRSKAGTGRWCSMSTCGNRMKARRHYRSRTDN